MQSTTGYLIQTFWNLVQWGGETDGPTTAEVLSRACDTHVVKKEEDLRHVRQREDGQRKVLNDARHATEEARGSLNAESRSLEACTDGLKERFRFLRDAINVALESSADDEPTETLRQLCVVAEEFSAKDFQNTVTTIEGKIDGARRHHRGVRQREDGAKARLEEMEAERRAIESHIDEIKRIKVQLDERLAPKALPRLPIAGDATVTAVAVPPVQHHHNDVQRVPSPTAPGMGKVPDSPDAYSPDYEVL
jgi:hypothetical protein